MRIIYDEGGEYSNFIEKADYRALESKVLAYLEKSKQKRSRREIVANMLKTSIVPESLIHVYLETALKTLEAKGTVKRSNSVLLPKWQFVRRAENDVFAPESRGRYLPNYSGNSRNNAL